MGSTHARTLSLGSAARYVANAATAAATDSKVPPPPKRARRRRRTLVQRNLHLATWPMRWLGCPNLPPRPFNGSRHVLLRLSLGLQPLFVACSTEYYEVCTYLLRYIFTSTCRRLGLASTINNYYMPPSPPKKRRREGRSPGSIIRSSSCDVVMLIFVGGGAACRLHTMINLIVLTERDSGQTVVCV